MKPSYTGAERRKLPLLELLTKRVVTLELAAQRQEELLELAVNHLSAEMTTVKDICRGCAGFQQDDFK